MYMARKRTPLVTDKQVLKRLRIEQLRGIKHLNEISFEGNPVTGIFGLNGSGKTTILQAILSLYRAKNSAENTKMSRFFKYTSSTGKWIGSSYSAVMDYEQLSGRQHKVFSDKEIMYKKLSSEWSPRQISKPDRSVIYIPLSESIPDIEKVSDKKVTFSPIEGESVDSQITSAASMIMGVKYEELRINRIAKMDCFTVKRNDILCHSFNLGAGEQKVFRVLQRIYRAPQYSLIVIDELDLTLHTAALRSLLEVMISESQKNSRKLQIVFTSHRHELMNLANFNVRFIINTPTKTFCLENPTDDCYEQMTGLPEKYLRVYMEDEIAEAIIVKCMKLCGMFKHFRVFKIGSITNSIRLALGLACQCDDLSEMDDIVFFCDGDVLEYTDDKRVKDQIKKNLSGCGESLQRIRDKVFSLIKHFCSSSVNGALLQPEEFIHETIKQINPQSSQYPELIRDSNSITNVLDKHQYVSLLLEKGYTIEDIVNLIAGTSQWSDYVREVMEWINERKCFHNVGLYDS